MTDHLSADLISARSHYSRQGRTLRADSNEMGRTPKGPPTRTSSCHHGRMKSAPPPAWGSVGVIIGAAVGALLLVLVRHSPGHIVALICIPAFLTGGLILTLTLLSRRRSEHP